MPPVLYNIVLGIPEMNRNATQSCARKKGEGKILLKAGTELSYLYSSAILVSECMA